MINKQDYVELGLSCADICRALDRGVGGKRLDDLSHSVCEAINQLTTWVGPAIDRLNGSPTMLLITERWQRSKGRSSNRAGGMQFLDSSTRRAIRR